MISHVESALRDTLAGEADTLAVDTDPWPRFVHAERRHRRARRVRAGAVAALLAVVIGVQVNVVPLPGWAPAIATASPSSTFSTDPTRGSLATDLPWLEGLRDQVKGIKDPDGLWEVADRSKIRMVYAGDVPGRRLALVLVPLRLGVIGAWSLIWYAGQPGATPTQMSEHGTAAADVSVATLHEGDAAHGGFALVVGPVGSTVTISPRFDYAPSGVVRHSQSVTSVGTGVGLVTLPPSAIEPGVTTEVTRDGRVLYAGTLAGGWAGSSIVDPQEPTDAMLAEAQRHTRGPRLDPEILRSFVSSVLRDGRLTNTGVTVRLRWSGTVDGQPAGLITAQPDGGGVLAYAIHGSHLSYRTDLRLLLPASGAERRPVAWRLRAEGRDDRTNRVLVIAPAGAVTASISVEGGPAIPVMLDQDGAGEVVLAPDRAAVVTAYATGDTPMASTPVPPFEGNSGGIPGDSPGTRIVD